MDTRSGGRQRGMNVVGRLGEDEHFLCHGGVDGPARRAASNPDGICALVEAHRFAHGVHGRDQLLEVRRRRMLVEVRLGRPRLDDVEGGVGVVAAEELVGNAAVLSPGVARQLRRRVEPFGLVLDGHGFLDDQMHWSASHGRREGSILRLGG
eukprot:scaffold1132_cov238-Pinguiococcus_pyrenoidosus.AAC.4